MTSIWTRLFPCRFHEPRCVGTPFGCRCGKGKGTVGKVLAFGAAAPFIKKATQSNQKAENRANDLAAQSQERAVAEQQQVQQLFQPNQSQMDIQSSLQQRGGLRGDELFGKISPQAQAYQQNYQIPFQDMLGPELQLLKQQVGAFANQRGIVGSGLELEQLGRTGSELAIREARLRQQNALTNQGLAQQLVSAQSGLQEGARGENIDYNTLLREQQLRGVQLGEGAYQQGQGQRQQFDQASLDTLNQRVLQRQQMVQNFGKLAADAVAVGAAPFTGGASLAALPAINSFGGGQSSQGSLFSGGGQNYTGLQQALQQMGIGGPGGYLNQQRSQGIPQNLSYLNPNWITSS